MELIKRFGHQGDEHFCLGINAKQSEMNAAMGLANFPYLKEIMSNRKRICDLYDSQLQGHIGRPKKQEDIVYNNAYYPVLFKDEKELLAVFAALNEKQIYPRRYFYPSLNKLPYLKDAASCPISEDITKRIACLPLFNDMTDEKVNLVCDILKGSLK